MSKAVIFFAPGLEECEGLLCVDILRRAGVEVTIAAVGGQKIVTSARGIHVVADALAEELDYAAFDACILPGGQRAGAYHMQVHSAAPCSFWMVSNFSGLMGTNRMRSPAA